MLLSSQRKRERVTADFQASSRSQHPLVRMYGATSNLTHGSSSGDFMSNGELVVLSPKKRAEDRNSSLILRALTSAGVLVLFGLGVSVAYSQHSFVRSEKHGEKGRLATEVTVLQVTEMPLVNLPSLTVTATNEYGEYDSASLALYGLEMVVEPYRETTLLAKGTTASTGTLFHWRIDQADDPDLPLEGVKTALDMEKGPEVTMTLTVPGGVYKLTVEERFPDGTIIAEGKVTVSCKYVRREIRDLTDADRNDFLDAMETYYTLSTAEGKATYGQQFFNYERLAAYHNAPLNLFCFHSGPQFLTAHAAFGLMMERSLQSVNPRVSLSFWDYMIEASTFGAEWTASDIFRHDMFGPAVGSAESSYQLMEGRFGNISSIYDPYNTLVDSRISPNHNAFGYLNAHYNYQDLPRLTRTSSFCNLESSAVFATADILFACFDDNETLTGWESCVEGKVHGDIHGLLGGAFNCNVDMQHFHEEHPEYDPGLLTFILEFLTCHYWPNNIFMPDYNNCDTECVRGQTEPCGCTCEVDAFSLSEDEIYALTSNFMITADTRFAGYKYVSYDESSDRPWGFKQDEVRLDDDSTMLLLRNIVKIGCEPGAVGLMCGGTSPMDPIFWVLHPIFEKALHVLWMSPKYRDKYSFEWEDGSCSGSNLDGELPFTEKGLGMGAGTNFLTNAKLMRLLNAANPRLPYVYEKFSQWGTVEDWDFCPECTASSYSADT